MTRAASAFIDVWRIDLDDRGPLAGLLSVLDAREQVQAGRFRFEQHGRRYIVAHAATRFILAAYLDVAARRLVFRCNAYGKPFLADGGAPTFNLSHSAGTGLLAVSDGGAIGVDIEQCRPLMAPDMIERFFSASERLSLATLAPDKKLAAFFACWTRKEAYIKAKGLGLSLALDAFSVECDPDRPARLIDSAFAPQDVAAFQFWDVPAADGFRAALAYCGDAAPAPMPRYRQWGAPEHINPPAHALAAQCVHRC